MTDGINADIRTFIIESFLFGDDSQPLPDDMSLIDNDLVDSTGILELVGFLEERFAVKIADADIVPANLDTIGKIAAFVARKQAS
ncbi:acyl carrier protein [Pararhizobium sp. PWRC1-1]|uniref:acyl carrier protein n=1 Tax=Pararhizobium sp. PWRC1-1 TaxID=2804566 RepID=UPI003CEA8DDE